MVYRDKMTLLDVLDQYRKCSDLEPNSVGYYKRVVNQLHRWNDGPVTLDRLTSELVNDFFAFLREEGKTPGYRRSLRTGILALWRYAASEGDAPHAPRTIARIRVPSKAVHTWSAAEVKRLREYASRVHGYFRVSGAPRADYFFTLIGAAWYTGLSQADLHRLTLADFRNGNLVIGRKKTGCRISVSIPEDDMRLIVRFAHRYSTSEIWPLWASPEMFRKTFRKIVKAAGLTGPFKTLRASAGTAYEIEHPGYGHLFLGNSRDVFMKNYFDTRRQPGELASAPKL